MEKVLQDLFWTHFLGAHTVLDAALNDIHTLITGNHRTSTSFTSADEIFQKLKL